MGAPPPSPARTPAWKKAAPLGCLVASILLVCIAPPPKALVEFIGSGFWARLALVLVVFLCLYLLLIALGILGGKVSLPFGLSMAKEESVESNVALLALATQLGALHEADKELFHRMAEMARLAEDTAGRVEEIERRFPNDGHSSAKRQR